MDNVTARFRAVEKSILMFAAIMLLAQFGCRAAPITGRRQVLLVPESQEVTMGVSAFQQTLASEKPSSNSKYVDMVNRVGQRIAAVADRPDYKWEFKVIESEQMNAFCLPGGKVAVYEGILPVCDNEAGLAVVMSHEIAHALLRHGGERMSHGYVVNGLGKAVNFALQNREKYMKDTVMQAYGVASEYGFVLPYSRKHESEADHVGLLLMAEAGYDPREAPRFWERFASFKGGEAKAEFLSTHPSDARRAGNLRDLLAEAVPIYDQTAKKYGIGERLPIALASKSGAGGSAPPSGGESSSGSAQFVGQGTKNALQRLAPTNPDKPPLLR